MTLSVRFYKKLILVILALLIVIPSVGCIFLALDNARLHKALAEAGDIPAAAQETQPEGEPIDYQLLYPGLYGAQPVPSERVIPSGSVYLTFDCTPGENTWQILNALDNYGVKATFFVTSGSGSGSQAVLKEIVNRGHTIGLLSYDGSYEGVYDSVGRYLEDFKQIYDYVYTATGVQCQIFRFPGGSVNAYNSGIYRELIAEMLRRGFVYYDWSVSGEDASAIDPGPEHIAQSVKRGMAGKQWAIISLRDSDGKEAVTQALPDVIRELWDMGYTLRPLTTEVMPVVFNYKNAP